MRCYRKILHISYKDHVTNEEVRAKIHQAIGPHEDLLTIVKRRKLQWYGHVSHSSDLAKTILQGTVKEERRQGGQRKRWEDNIREVRQVPEGSGEQGRMEKTGCKIICGAPTTLVIKGLMMMMMMMIGITFTDAEFLLSPQQSPVFFPLGHVPLWVYVCLSVCVWCVCMCVGTRM